MKLEKKYVSLCALVLVMFNTDKFMENTKLGQPAQTEKKEQTMQAFEPEEFLG